jgi:flagellum-specific peptidoglycan hydrolase FlgJ
MENSASTAKATHEGRLTSSPVDIDDQCAAEHDQEERSELEEEAEEDEMEVEVDVEENHHELGDKDNYAPTDDFEDDGWQEAMQFIDKIAKEAELHAQVDRLAKDMITTSLTTATNTSDNGSEQMDQSDRKSSKARTLD